MKNKVHVHVIKIQLCCSGQQSNLKFGDQLCRFHVSQLFLQELTTMDILDMVLQWPCGLTGEWAQMACYNHIKVMMGMGDGGSPVL